MKLENVVKNNISYASYSYELSEDELSWIGLDVKCTLHIDLSRERPYFICISTIPDELCSKVCYEEINVSLDGSFLKPGLQELFKEFKDEVTKQLNEESA